MTPAAERLEALAEDLCGAALRALAGDPSLAFRGRRLWRAHQPVVIDVPHLALHADELSAATLRGAADAIALRLAWSDDARHRAMRPQEPIGRQLFDLLEQLRVESLVHDHLPGVRRNLQALFDGWCEAWCANGALDTERGLLVFALALMARASVCRQPIPPHYEDLTEIARMTLGPRIGAAVPRLAALRNDQAAYGGVARDIAAAVAALYDDPQQFARRATPAERPPRRETALIAWTRSDDDRAEGGSSEDAGRATLPESPPYRVFTRAYDRQAAVASLARPEQLQAWRARLDQALARAPVNLHALTRTLIEQLALPATRGWNDAQESGHVDGRRLTQLIANPAERHLFRQERQEPVTRCQLAFLVDCSGSMKRHAHGIAMLLDPLLRALEQAGAATEVLGFTTGGWHGGRAQRDWLRAGRPAAPGRLNELCHLVFKDARRSWRQARRDLAGLYKADLFREAIDGEALSWACDRLRSTGDRDTRRVLVVISDGCPMDAATAQANDERYLDAHLRTVIDREQRRGDVELRALGTSADIGHYYPHRLVADLSQPPEPSLYRALAALVGRHR